MLRILWRLLEFAEKWFNQIADQEDREQELTPVVKLFVIVGKFLILLFGLTVLLSHFGIDVTLFVAALGIGGLALSLGARDLMSDLIAGITILLDRPFRVGDRIDVDAAEAWGDVVDIGLRTTRIRTLDNRLVIVPNSVIAKNEVINYSFPDPTYRYQTNVGVAYGTDIEAARQIILDAVRQIDEVLQDRPVEALYIEMGDSSIVFKVRWWMGSYTDTRNLEDQVLTQIHAAFDAAGIDIPFPQQDVHLDITSETVEQISREAKD